MKVNINSAQLEAVNPCNNDLFEPRYGVSRREHELKTRFKLKELARLYIIRYTGPCEVNNG